VTPLKRLVALPEAEKHELGVDFAAHEIAQQPETWQKTYSLFLEHRGRLQEFLRQAQDERWTVYLVGAGSSDYIGHSIANLLRRRWQCEVFAVASTDLLGNPEDLVLPGRDYLWISFSRSGDSPEGVAVLEHSLAANPRVRHLVVSCNERGAMARMARGREGAYAVVLDDAVNDRGLAMTSSFTNMVVFGQALAHVWELDDFETTLAAMTEAAEYLLEDGAVLAYDLARRGIARACFVGAGGLAATARESSLKLMELTSGAIQTLFESTLGLRHGPMSSLNSETLFTAFLSRDKRRRQYDLDLIRQVKSKRSARTIVGIGGGGPDCDYVLDTAGFARIDDAYRPAVDVIFAQMLGVFASLELGLSPDAPSPSGVISRVVESFTIYV